MKKHRWIQKKYIPNYLTIFRIFIMVIVIILILIPKNQTVYSLPLDFQISVVKANFDINDIVAGSLFILASITDSLDGYLARKYHWISDFGKLWDPLADKLLINGTLICFAAKGLIPIWIVVILILRDIIVDAFRMTALQKSILVPSHKLGKWKTTFQMIGIIFIFFFFRFDYELAQATKQVLEWYLIQNLMMIIATIFSLASMVEYIKFISNAIKNKQEV